MDSAIDLMGVCVIQKGYYFNLDGITLGNADCESVANLFGRHATSVSITSVRVLCPYIPLFSNLSLLSSVAPSLRSSRYTYCRSLTTNMILFRKRALLNILGACLATSAASFVHQGRDNTPAVPNVTTQTPQIWVAQGSVSCGAPFLSAECVETTTFSQIMASMEVNTFWATDPEFSTLTTTVYSEYRGNPTTWYYTSARVVGSVTTLVTYTDYWTACGLAPCSTILSPVKIYSLTSPAYSPTIISGSYEGPTLNGPTVTVPVSSTVTTTYMGKFRRNNDSNVVETSSSEYFAPISYRSGDPPSPLEKRTTDPSTVIDNCKPGDGTGWSGGDFQTNDLLNVCRFVGDSGDLFVSLAPTPSAFMPTWLDYLMSFIFNFGHVVSFMIDESKKQSGDRRALEPDRHPGIIKTMSGVVGFLLGTFRLTLALRRLVTRSSNGFKTLPFISPILWLDWLVVSDSTSPLSKIAQVLSGFVAFAVYCICFWLAVGYGCLGYGTEQYHIISVPGFCQFIDAAWQTDPRRVRFLLLHILIFSLATIGGLIHVSTLARQSILKFKSSIQASLIVLGSIIRGVLGKLILSYKSEAVDWDTALTRAKANQSMAWLYGMLMFAHMAAILCAGLSNRNDFILLHHQSCWASYVSGRMAYVDIEFHEWERRIATWFGVNV